MNHTKVDKDGGDEANMTELLASPGEDEVQDLTAPEEAKEEVEFNLNDGTKYEAPPTMKAVPNYMTFK